MSDVRGPVTLDVVLRALDQIPFSWPFVGILPLLALVYERRGAESWSGLVFPWPTVSEWHDVLMVRHPFVVGCIIFILLKYTSMHMSRLALNLGEPRPDKPDWKEDVIVITGGSMGIGKELVQILSREHKARMAVLDVLEPTYAAASHGAPDILYIRTDVTSEQAVAQAQAQIIERFGRSPSYVVSCAGVAPAGSLLTSPVKMFTRAFDINAAANVVLAQAFLPAMISNNHGHFMTVASSASYFSLPNLCAYSMSKTAALAFLESLRAELRAVYKACRVRTSVVTPTKVRTVLAEGLNEGDDDFLMPVLEPIQVARAMADTLNSGLSRNISLPLGSALLPYLRALPEWYRGALRAMGNTDALVTPESISRGQQALRGHQSNLDHMKKLGVHS